MALDYPIKSDSDKEVFRGRIAPVSYLVILSSA
jgi:hypothetical protein